MFENTKVIVCDIDKTLVEKYQLLSERALNTIKKLRENGILFGLASGRNISDLKYIISTWNLNELDFIVGLNGSELYDIKKDELHTYFQMEPEWIKETFEIMRPFKYNPVMYYGKAYMCGEFNESVHYSIQYTKADYVIAKSEEDFYQQPNAKMMFRIDAKDMPALEERIKLFENPNYKGNKTQPTLMEFQHRDASKAFAIEKFCEFNGLTLENVAAFGDTSNDNEMIASAGVGVVMANGSDDTKALADIITEKPCSEDGWADFIENVFFNEKGWN